MFSSIHDLCHVVVLICLNGVVSGIAFAPYLSERKRWESGVKAEDSRFCCLALLIFFFILIISCAPVSMCSLPMVPSAKHDAVLFSIILLFFFGLTCQLYMKTRYVYQSGCHFRYQERAVRNEQVAFLLVGRH